MGGGRKRDEDVGAGVDDKPRRLSDHSRDGSPRTESDRTDKKRFGMTGWHLGIGCRVPTAGIPVIPRPAFASAVTAVSRHWPKQLQLLHTILKRHVIFVEVSVFVGSGGPSDRPGAGWESPAPRYSRGICVCYRRCLIRLDRFPTRPQTQTQSTRGCESGRVWTGAGWTLPWAGTANVAASHSHKSIFQLRYTVAVSLISSHLFFCSAFIQYRASSPQIHNHVTRPPALRLRQTSCPSSRQRAGMSRCPLLNHIVNSSFSIVTIIFIISFTA